MATLNLAIVHQNRFHQPGDFMAIESELSSDIATVMLNRGEDSPDERAKLMLVLKQVHKTLSDLSEKCKPQARRRLLPIADTDESSS